LPALILVESDAWKWFLRLGGPGLIFIGAIDSSFIPLPGSTDLSVILLTSRKPEWWLYYAVMATVGGLIGGYLTYRLAKKGGKEGLEKKIGPAKAKKIYKRFEKSGFITILLGSLLPPPFPLVPVLMAAGVLQYSPRRFLPALGIGRGTRFFIVALLGRLYGTAIVGWLGRYYKPFLYFLIAAAVLGSIATLLYFKWYRPRHQAGAASTP